MTVGGSLGGCRIVITRPREQAGELAELIAARGGEPVIWPLIRIAPPADPAPLDRALGRLEEFAWIALTSANAARAVLDRLRALGPGPAALARTRVACVGERTAQAVRQEGGRVHLVPGRADAAALAEELLRAGPPGGRVLLPRSDRAAPELPQALRAGGMVPVEVEAYRTEPVAVPPDDPVLAAVREGGVDAVLLMSGSAALALAQALGPDLPAWASRPAGRGRPAVACIGAPTAAAARRAGLPVDAVADRAGGAELVEAARRALEDAGRVARRDRG